MMISTIIDALNAAGTQGGSSRFCLIRLGQQYDGTVSGSFLDKLAFPDPDINLVVTDSITKMFSLPANPLTTSLPPSLPQSMAG
jgi:hypothetical protein